jgi:hypothetical protein
MREFETEGFRVQLDLRAQVLRLDIPEDRSFGRLDGPLHSKQEEAPLAPTLSDTASDELVSASVLAQKAKQFDDGLYAAVDLAAQQGADSFAGKAALLKKVAGALASLQGIQGSSSASVIFGACQVGRVGIEVPKGLEKWVGSTVDQFLKDPLRSKPIGFYTWNEELAAIFRQDRMLQTELRDKMGIEALIKILQADREAADIYQNYLSLAAGLTNPLAYPDLRAQISSLQQDKSNAPSSGIYFFPPSRSHETELIKQLYGSKPIPDGFSLIEEMIKGIQTGALNLSPSPESGWYDYQSWSLEPLVIPEKMPETRHLDFAPSYRRQLLELFKGILALTRETHIKQLEIPRAGAAAPGHHLRPVIRISPELDAEPLPTMYLRRAQSYHFIRSVIEKAFGVDALGKMQGLRATGPVNENLGEELRKMEALFYGAHCATCRQIGMPISDSVPQQADKVAEEAVAEWKSWIGTLQQDADLSLDARMMVPTFYDIERKKTKVWAFLGWSDKPLMIDFTKRPEVTIFDQSGKQIAADNVDLQFLPRSHRLAYPVTAEVYVSEILDRDTFRQLCDRHKTQSAILANLK